MEDIEKSLDRGEGENPSPRRERERKISSYRREK
jgi:hypothetical protein